MFEPTIRLTTRGLRWLYITILSVTLVSFAIYVSTRLRATYRLASIVAKQTEEMNAYKESSDAIHESMALRLNELERAVYASAPDEKAVMPPARKPSVEQWQLNRDMELRNRIRELERWRLGQETKAGR